MKCDCFFFFFSFNCETKKFVETKTTRILRVHYRRRSSCNSSISTEIETGKDLLTCTRLRRYYEYIRAAWFLNEAVHTLSTHIHTNHSNSVSMCGNEPATVAGIRWLTRSHNERRRFMSISHTIACNLAWKCLTCVYGLCYCDVSFATYPSEIPMVGSNTHARTQTHTHKHVCVPFHPSIWRFVVLLLAFFFFFFIIVVS